MLRSKLCKRAILAKSIDRSYLKRLLVTTALPMALALAGAGVGHAEICHCDRRRRRERG